MVLLFVRPPRAGRVKTRLARTEGAAEALRTYRALAGEVHATLREAARAGVLDLVLAVADEQPGDLEAVAAWLPGARAAWPQGPGDLGARMERMLLRALAGGAPAVLLVGSDVRGLTAGRLGAALAALAGHDVLLGPTPDGGYGLLGLKAPAPTLLRGGLPWSTPAVAAVTRARAQAAGLRCAELAGLHDVDTAADLAGVRPTLSVLVPVLDEMPRLPGRLAPLLAQARALGDEVEVLVVDGGSQDGSLAAARALCAAAPGARVLQAPRGRGTQLAAAAAQARGRWLWTVHADAALAPGLVARVLAFAQRGTHPWAVVRTRIDAPGPLLRVLGMLTDVRAWWLGLPYGDQGVLVKRSLYDRVGGYDAIPLLEDVALAARLRRRQRPARIAGPGLAVDARRWQRLGFWRVTAGNLGLLARFLLGRASPARLARSYARALG
ncbi:MAG: TIGR04282 family arsenosugar biosynthesis glycosyltransferase [Planctomycetia bacterium]